MTDTGLSNRLRQHSRRSGIAVGLTMAATIALCILTSAYIFGQIEPYVAEVTVKPGQASPLRHKF